MTDWVKDDSDKQRAAWAASNILAVPEIELGNLEAVPARAGEVKDALELVPDKVLDFDLV